jgi:GNAT superfamily N-acetyltransferase
VGGAPFEIVPLGPQHVAAAAALAAEHVAALRARLPLLPERWTQADAYLDRLGELIGAGPAAAALLDGQLVGYLGGFGWERVGTRNVFSPEWANVCVGESAGEVRQELYAEVAREWLADDRPVHYIGLLPSDGEAIRALGWLGFGHSNADGLRSLDPVAAGDDIAVVAASPADAADVLELEMGLRAHLAATPLFFVHGEAPSIGDVAEQLRDEQRVTLLARDERGPLAYLRIGPSSDDAATIIRDPGTASITRAFTRADRRGSGVATTLLNAALAWARERGHVRCAVDYETANLLASRFWARYFEPVGVTVRRRI